MKSTALFFGIAVGIGIGYYLATDDKDELIANVKDSVNKAKDMVETGINKGRKLIDDVKSR
ncbi:MAG: YtxH domain-containing protein, partial [Chitinophagales bacterium]|nr:YtxH domain-containing protein [Chitinophagales bacterium]